MFRILLFLLAFIPSLAAAVNATDIQHAVDIVAPIMNMPVQVEVVQTMEDPMGAGWKPFTSTCMIYVSEQNVGYLGLLLFTRPAEKMLEGLVAHEIAHCIDQRAVLNQVGFATAHRMFATPSVVLQSEILGDIVAIMYWKQEYPKDADYLTGGLLDWRRLSAEADELHATYPALAKALPSIPNHISYTDALNIRANVRIKDPQ